MKKEDNIQIAISVISIIGVAIAMKYVFSHKARLKRQANKDLRKWEGKTETSPEVSKYLVDYWKKAGLNFSESQMQSSGFQSSYPWSSAYIGHLVDSAGYKHFTSKPTHSAYVVEAKNNRASKQKRSYWAYKPSELNKVQVGDILVQGRSGSKPNLDTINSGVLSHGDIVVDLVKENGVNYALLQGGNLGNTVQRTKERLGDKKEVINSKYFAQLRYVQ